MTPWLSLGKASQRKGISNPKQVEDFREQEFLRNIKTDKCKPVCNAHTHRWPPHPAALGNMMAAGCLLPSSKESVFFGQAMARSPTLPPEILRFRLPTQAFWRP